MAQERTRVNIRLVKLTEEQKEEDYGFIDEYQEIDAGTQPGNTIYGTMLVLDEEIGKLNVNSRVLSPCPVSWRIENTPTRRP